MTQNKVYHPNIAAQSAIGIGTPQTNGAQVACPALRLFLCVITPVMVGRSGSHLAGRVVGAVVPTRSTHHHTEIGTSLVMVYIPKPTEAIMPNTISIGHTTEIPLVFYRNQPVITFAMIDRVHGRPEGTARKRFNDNKERFIEQEDFYRLTFQEVESVSEFRTAGILPNSQGLTLITETGYLMLVKSFTDDLAWQIQRQLVKAYFRAKAPAPASQKMSNSQAKELLQDIHHAFASWCFNGADAQTLFNRIRAQYSISRFEDLPEDQTEAVKVLISEVKAMNLQFLDLMHDMKQSYLKEYVGASAPWTPDLKRKWREKFQEELPARPNWQEVQKQISH